MNYNINDILPYVENYEFSEYFTSREEDFLISSIDCDELSFDWEDGASKLVIIPEDKDYVIKIPFNASCDTFLCEYYDYSYNYCEKECNLYKKISFEENPLFTQFFLPLTKVREFENWEVYIQPKCQIYNHLEEEDRSKTYSKDSMMKVKSKKLGYYTNLPDDWIAAVTEMLKDTKLVKEFIDMLQKYDITQDLHSGNIGYYNGKPVILDYAGFYDN